MLPCIETYQKVDLRTITLDVPPQEVLTRDSVTVSVGECDLDDDDEDDDDDDECNLTSSSDSTC